MNKQIIFLFILIITSAVIAEDYRREINLKGYWRFEIGDNSAYAKPSFDDSDWEEIRVPDDWESQGYPGYDGFAWYRKTFEITDNLRNEALVIMVGAIDDVDRVYVNGRFIGGEGKIEPEYVTAYNVQRIYPLPREVLNLNGKNVVAIQVYDDWGEGGIRWGDVGIYSHREVRLQIDLSGEWLFRKGDSQRWLEGDINERHWEPMPVPSKWSTQGLEDYDGYAWYRKTFVMNKNLRGEKLVLVLGRIDDIDEVYINGERVGRTGRFPAERYRQNSYDWQKDRYYILSPDVFRWGEENVIAVRIYDFMSEGGIYQGPIGIATRADYLDFVREKKKIRDDEFKEGWEKFLEAFEDLF